MRCICSDRNSNHVQNLLCLWYFSFHFQSIRFAFVFFYSLFDLNIGYFFSIQYWSSDAIKHVTFFAERIFVIVQQYSIGSVEKSREIKIDFMFLLLSNRVTFENHSKLETIYFHFKFEKISSHRFWQAVCVFNSSKNEWRI